MASAPPTMFPGLNNKEINFEIKSNTGKMFYINLLNQEEYLIITAYYISNKNRVEYESKFDISYIKKVKLFILYDTINECLEEINLGINTGKSYLVEEKNYINIFIPLNNIKFNEINIINLKNKVNQLEILVNDLLIFKKDIVGKITFKINSKIVDSYFNIILIKNWINNINNESSKIIKAKLLYKLSKDGDSIDTFHQKCDNNSPTLLLVETTNGRKFGGYTTCVWSVNKGGKKDGKTFLFSLDEKKLYKKKKEHENERDIYCRKDAGPTFGGNDLYFYQTLKKGYSASPYYFLDKNDLAKNIKDDFDIKEIEIFKICFE